MLFVSSYLTHARSIHPFSVPTSPFMYRYREQAHWDQVGWPLQGNTEKWRTSNLALDKMFMEIQDLKMKANNDEFCISVVERFVEQDRCVHLNKGNIIRNFQL